MADTSSTRRRKSQTVAEVASKAIEQSQSDRFIAKARELGLDEREESFDAALKKVARHKVLAKESVEKPRR